MINKTLSLLQLCDSSFPTGAFSHSFGLESYIQEDIVHDKESFFDWLCVYLHEQLVYSDGLAAGLVYDALEEEEYDTLWELDHLLHMQNFASEVRNGTKMMGDRMLKMAETLYDSPILQEYRKRIKEKESFGHPAIVFTIVGHYLEVDKETTMLHYLYSTIVSIIQNAVRAIPLGQTLGQQVLHEFQTELMKALDRIRQLGIEDLGIVSPGLELSQMRHERVNVRIFMS